ncbi:hypothetical protein [Spiroplasma monobiae]|uniref:Uncharacterized protein n=1 Tax=Spiroplasma monobiae MQ-1 TaxID=1336748 RepID=A0A2K9LVD1_SPISQ|nr:hypothetical protein [Spiroplasma monobiae]AUM62881.1 hypothetical protein SMONO_v1c06320 [Spiroplasma monobiae MQ-1]
MYKKKKVWATIGSKIVTNLSYYNDVEFSEDEVFELIANDEYLLDDSEEIYGKKLISFLIVWNLIRLKIIESKENYREGQLHKWAFKPEDYMEIYILLDETKEYIDAFDNLKDGTAKTIKMIEFFEESLIEEATIEALLEDLLITMIYFAIEKPLGQHTNLFIYLISNAMLLYRNLGPIFLNTKSEMMDLSKMILVLISQCKGLRMEHFNRADMFQKVFKKLLDISESTKLMLDAM